MPLLFAPLACCPSHVSKRHGKCSHARDPRFKYTLKALFFPDLYLFCFSLPPTVICIYVPQSWTKRSIFFCQCSWSFNLKWKIKVCVVRFVKVPKLLHLYSDCDIQTAATNHAFILMWAGTTLFTLQVGGMPSNYPWCLGVTYFELSPKRTMHQSKVRFYWSACLHWGCGLLHVWRSDSIFKSRSTIPKPNHNSIQNVWMITIFISFYRMY